MVGREQLLFPTASDRTMLALREIMNFHHHRHHQNELSAVTHIDYGLKIRKKVIVLTFFTCV